MPTRLTTQQAQAVKSAEQEAARCVASLREWRSSGMVYARQVRGTMERLERIAEKLDAMLDELEG